VTERNLKPKSCFSTVTASHKF